MTVTNLWKTFLPILCAGCLMTACSKDSDNPFSGIDNHIISFTLEKGDSKWQAAIIDNQIVLTVPEKTELTNAKINYRLSELATINPDPSTITAWDEERQFTVTSYNGTSQVYKYTIQRSATSETGNFTFNSQAEIDAFAQEHQVSVIKGNVYIGTAESKDTITNLNALKEIKEITYSLNIGQYYQGTDLAGLSNLEKLGSLSIQDEINKLALESISLPKLESIGEGFYIDCRKSATKEISMPSLKMALTDCAIECPTIEKLNLNSLETLGGKLSINELSNDNKTLTDIELPNLQTAVGDIRMKNLKSLSSFSCPKLKTCGGFYFYSIPELSYLNMKALTTITHQAYFFDCSKWNDLNGSLQSLKKCNSLYLFMVGIKQLNARGIEFGELTIQGIDKFKLIGDEKFSGTLIARINTVELEGISKLGGLKAQAKGSLTFDGITEITGKLMVGSVPGGKVTEIHLPNLVTLGGFNPKDPKDSWVNNIPVLDCPKLTKITGDFLIETGNDEATMDFYQAPKLTTIGGTLKMRFTGWDAKRITHLNCFNKLEHVGKVEIIKFGYLTSFSGLKTVADNMQNEESWSVTECAYNPKLSDMKAGKTENPTNE